MFSNDSPLPKPAFTLPSGCGFLQNVTMLTVCHHVAAPKVRWGNSPSRKEDVVISEVIQPAGTLFHVVGRTHDRLSQRFIDRANAWIPLEGYIRKENRVKHA